MDDTDFLKKISFFKDLTTGDLLKIRLLAENTACQAEDQIMEEGTACDAIYIIKDGSAKVLISGSHVETVGAGDVIGEVAFIDKGLRTATLVANENMSLLRIPSDAFEQVMSRDKDLAVKVYKAIIVVLCKRLRDANEALKIIPDYIKESYNI